MTSRPTRLLAPLTAVALALPGVGALDAAAEHAPRPTITDPAGDANGTDPRGLDPRAPTGAAPVPVNDAGRDLRRVSLSRRGAALVVRLELAAAPEGAVHVEVRVSTPSCDAVVLTWVTDVDASLQGCRANQRRTWDGMRAVDGGLELVVRLSDLPGWFAPGTQVTALTVTTSRRVELGGAAAVITTLDVATGSTNGRL